MFMLIVLFQLVLSCLPVHNLDNKRGFGTIYEWKQLEFDYPSQYDKERDIQNGILLPGVPTPIDVDIYYSKYSSEDKIFVTIPRFQSMTPASLGTVSAKRCEGNPVITPYPNWNWHTDYQKCKKDRIVSVFRIQIDECGRLWVLDSGKIMESLVCPPQLLVFDLMTDQLIHRYEIPQEQYESRSIFVTPIVEVLDKNNYCRNTFAYLADCQTYSLVVYDYKNDRSWRITDKTMYPDPEYGTYTIKGDSFELMDGILGMSLSPATDGPERKLYYHAMSSSTEHWVYTSYLRNQSLFTKPQPALFCTFPSKRQTQSASEAIDRHGVMYFGLIGDVKMACYNIRSPTYGSWDSTDIIADNPLTMQFPTGVKAIVNQHNEDELWILTSRLQKAIAQTINMAEVNFRILAAKTKSLITGSQCMRAGVEDIFLTIPVKSGYRSY